MSLKTSYKITIPTTNGFIGRKCSNQDCGKYFQIHQTSISKELICPYCGQKNPIEDMWTKEQADYSKKVVIEELRPQIITEFNNIFKKAFSGSKNITYKSNPTPYIKKTISPPKENLVDSEIICSECNGRFQVYGIFGFCPLCKYENIKIYDANLAIIQRDIENAENKQGALRHAYGDIVSTFEDFCKKYATKGANVNFQNLRSAKKYFKKESNFDIYEGLTDDEKTQIKRVFMKRHVYIHAKGLITEEFVREVPQDAKLINQQATLSVEELNIGAQILRKIINNIVNKPQ